MPIIRDTFKTTDFEAGIKKLDVRDKIYLLQPDETPYYQLVMKAKPEVTRDTQFSWFEDDLITNYTTVNGAHNNTTTSIIVTDASIFKPYDVVKVLSTGEVMLITDVNTTTNVLTVRRGWGTTTASSIANGAYLFKLGTAVNEGGVAPLALFTSKVKISNYTQIFKRAVKVTKTADAVATYGGNKRNFERKKQAIELKRDIEAQFIWGEPKEDTSGGTIIRQTAGIIYFINTYGGAVMDLNGSPLTEDAFDNWLKDLFTYTSEDVYVLCGPKHLSVINGWAKEALKTVVTDKKYGIQIRQYIHSMGIVNLVLSRQFIAPNDNIMIGIRPGDIFYRYLEGRDLKLELDLQKGDEDFYLDQYIAEIGLEVHLAKHHGLIKNIG